ncbi:M20 family metallopeptidase [Niallia oryzisoli]|uniref:M20 family metallopeptidase n=1 Tax=Niallia oryzisoli TaxID=1737571 RepID=A0ABZ2CBI7_9BACI
MSFDLLNDDIKRLVERAFDDAVRYRRQFHANPELGYQEFKTSAAISTYLEELGYEVQTGLAGTGVVGVLRGTQEKPVIAFRSDMDALPILEKTNAAFASQNENVMHACGHDMHMGTLLGAAKALSLIKDQIPAKIKLIFQPAEEMLCGGRKMVEDGALKNPDVDFIYGFHVWPDLPLGTIGFKGGPIMASMDTFQVTLKGRSGHGAQPHQGIDAIIGGAQILTALQSIVSRNTDPLDSVVITVGTFTAGDGFNIIPETAQFNGTIRTLSKETRNRVENDFRRIVNGIASAMALEAEISFSSDYPVTINSFEHAEHAGNLAAELFGEKAVEHLEIPSMGSEDFAYYLENVPGSFMFLGVKDDQGGAYKLHNDHFLPEEEAMKYGMSLYIALALNPYSN